MLINMPYVQQDHTNGCGLASVAMIADKNYKELVKVFIGQDKKYEEINVELKNGLRIKKVNRILKDCNPEMKLITRSETPICLDELEEKVEKLGTTLLILIKFNGECGSSKRLGHWVVYDPKTKKINDPDPREQPNNPSEQPNSRHSPIRIDKFIEHYHKKCSHLKLYRVIR